MGKIFMDMPDDAYKSDSEVVNASNAIEDYLDALPLTKEQHDRACALVSRLIAVVGRVAFASTAHVITEQDEDIGTLLEITKELMADNQKKGGM